MTRAEKIRILNNKKVKTADGFKIELWDKTISWRKIRSGLASIYDVYVEYKDGKGKHSTVLDDQVEDFILNEMDEYDHKETTKPKWEYIGHNGNTVSYKLIVNDDTTIYWNTFFSSKLTNKT